MAGTWQAVVNGFGGVRCGSKGLSFAPVLPEKWESCCFKVQYRGSVLRVNVTKNRADFSLLEGAEISFSVYGKQVNLKMGEQVSFRMHEGRRPAAPGEDKKAAGHMESGCANITAEE